MKFYLATDALEDVRWATARGLIDGVVLPDSALMGGASPEDALRWLAEFARAVSQPVFVALIPTAVSGAIDASRELGRTADNVVVQLPLNDDTVQAMHQLYGDGIRVAATFVGSAAQALLAAKAGAAFVLLDVDRIEAAGGNGASVVRDTCQLLDTIGSETEVVALFPGSGARVVACATAGAHAAVVGTSALRALLAYPFTEQALADGAHRAAMGERLRANTP